MGDSKENYQWDLGSERVNVISQGQPWRKNKKIKKTITEHEYYSMKSLSPLKSQTQTRRYVNDAAFFVSAKKKHAKIMDFRCKSSRQFFVLLPLLPHFFLYRTPIYLHLWNVQTLTRLSYNTGSYAVYLTHGVRGSLNDPCPTSTDREDAGDGTHGLLFLSEKTTVKVTNIICRCHSKGIIFC